MPVSALNFLSLTGPHLQGISIIFIIINITIKLSQKVIRNHRFCRVILQPEEVGGRLRTIDIA